MNRVKNDVQLKSQKEMVDHVAEEPTFIKQSFTGGKTWEIGKSVYILNMKIKICTKIRENVGFVC